MGDIIEQIRFACAVVFSWDICVAPQGEKSKLVRDDLKEHEENPQNAGPDSSHPIRRPRYFPTLTPS
jgi:hypothetical protein